MLESFHPAVRRWFEGRFPDGPTEPQAAGWQEIAEETTEPWPAASGPAYGGFPEPDGAIVGDELYLWFGDRTAPVLALEPIDLSEVLLRD